jgi:hypothetical protein
MSNATGGPVDRLVKERWIEIGLSQADLAEVLGKDEQKSLVDSSPQNMSSLQSLLELRLLRAFHELRDYRAKRILVRLAECIIKRQVKRGGDAG